MLSLRPYQFDAVRATQAGWARGLRSPALVLPPGAGKTVILAAVTKQHHEALYPPVAGSRGSGRRTLIVAHRTELIEQAANKVGDIAPELSVGIVKAQRNETRADVVVASVQTLAAADRRAMLDDIGLVIIDECHRAAAESYLRVLTHFGVRGGPEDWGQRAPAFGLGVTATMVRSDERALGSVWQEVVYSIGITDLISAGYLVRPRPAERIYVDDLDLSSVRTNHGDFSEGDLGRVITDSSAPEAIAQAILKYAPNGRGFIFAPTVEAGRAILAAVLDVGQSAAMATGKTAAGERAGVIADFRAGRVRWLVNCALWTEGTDVPEADTVIIARPTKSRGLYLQMVGRVLRTWPGKSDALVMDVVGVTQEHSLITPIRLYGDESAKLNDPDDLAADGAVDLDGADAGEDLTLAGPIIEFGQILPPGVVGQLRSEAVDLFAGSSSDWLCTRGGTWFLPAGERYIALVPGVEPGTFDVTEMHARQHGTGRWIVNGIHDMSYAMAYAEGAVTAAEMTTARRGRSWKAKKPTQQQRDLAIKLGLPVHEGMTSGELGSMITVVFASRRIDGATARLMGAR